MAIYQVHDVWVCSSGGCYLPGEYESATACRIAFRLTDSDLWDLWNPTKTDGPITRGPITADELRAVLRTKNLDTAYSTYEEDVDIADT